MIFGHPWMMQIISSRPWTMEIILLCKEKGKRENLKTTMHISFGCQWMVKIILNCP
jgi:hypothetical protein